MTVAAVPLPAAPLGGEVTQGLLDPATTTPPPLNDLIQASLLPWFWASAIFFPLKSLHGSLRTVIEINPVTGVILLFRAAVVGGDPGWTSTIPWMVGWAVGLFLLAGYLFRRFDRVFVDLL